MLSSNLKANCLVLRTALQNIVRNRHLFSKCQGKRQKAKDKENNNEYFKEHEKAKAFLDKYFETNHMYWDVSNVNPYLFKCYQPKKPILLSRNECEVIMTQLFPGDTKMVKEPNAEEVKNAIADEAAKVAKLASTEGYNIDWSSKTFEVKKGKKDNPKLSFVKQAIVSQKDNEKQNWYTAEKVSAEIEKHFNLLDEKLRSEQKVVVHEAFSLTVTKKDEQKQEAVPKATATNLYEKEIDIEEEIYRFLNPHLFETKHESKTVTTTAEETDNVKREPTFNVEEEIQKQLHVISNNCKADHSITSYDVVFDEQDDKAESTVNSKEDMSDDKETNIVDNKELFVKTFSIERALSSNQSFTADPDLDEAYAQVSRKDPNFMQNALLKAEAKNYTFDPAYFNVTYKFSPIPCRRSFRQGGAAATKICMAEILPDFNDKTVSS